MAEKNTYQHKGASKRSVKGRDQQKGPSPSRSSKPKAAKAPAAAHPSKAKNVKASAAAQSPKPKAAKAPKTRQKATLPPRSAFLPVSRQDMQDRGWDQCDFVYVCGDAYVDHSSFGMAIITRLLESHGFKVGVIAQPDWNDPESIAVLGKPRLGFLVSAGNMDSMVNHYTVAKKRRHNDAYSPGNQAGLRPDRAVIVYGNLIRRTFKDTPIIIGGIEASLRRMAHYDYWQDKLRRSVLLDSGADIISYGMGEHSILQIAEGLDAGLAVSDLTYIDGTVYRTGDLAQVYDYQLLPSYESMVQDKLNYAKSFNVQYQNSDPITGKRLVEPYERDGIYVVQNPPSLPLTTDEMDAVYRLPFAGTYHPDYEEAGGVPAIKEVKFSLTSNRGCFGECSFCALTFHQGRIVTARSHQSLIDEATAMTRDPEFKGYLHDVGGPTANFRGPACDRQLKRGACKNKHCLWPEPCKKLNASHQDYLQLLRELRALPGVKKVFVRSGIRFDYLLAEGDDTFLTELAEHHVSGQLRVAPEHVSDQVLSLMHKPSSQVYAEFQKRFYQVCKKLGKEQYVVPYLMSSHPGSTLSAAVELAECCRDLGYMPEQVQDFYPTPSTMSTAMYFTGVDPRTMQPVYVPKSPHEKALQRALIQYRKPENYDLVEEALTKAGRRDLIGYGKECLIRPRKGNNQKGQAPQGQPHRQGKPSRNQGAGNGRQDRPGKREQQRSRRRPDRSR